DCEPPIIPRGNSLRALKARKLASERRHEDTLTALALMQKEEDFFNVLHDIRCNPFFLHYYLSEQIHIYRQYCRSFKYPKLIIDATDSAVKPFKKLNSEKTKTIFLYEGIQTGISNWLLNWLNSDVPVPKQTVCDQSLALLSAIVKCFTQYSSLQGYIRACASLLNGDFTSQSYWVPRCFVRIDIAHFIKTITKWIPLKSVV
ncbi:Uncharacterized protein FWK35_00033560, partial [Aphis craccivora]